MQSLTNRSLIPAAALLAVLFLPARHEAGAKGAAAPQGGGTGKGSAPAAVKKKGAGKDGGGAGKVLVWLRTGKVVEGGVEVEVQPGQRLQDIAKAYGIATGELLAANPQLDGSKVKAGEKVLVPGATSVKAVKMLVPADEIGKLEGGAGAAGEKAEGFKVKSGAVVKGGVLHTVMPGQSVWDISKAYDVKIGDILAANGLKGGAGVKTGKKLLVPGAKEAVAVRCSKKALRSMVYTQPVTFHRIHTGETKSLSLFTPAGKVDKQDFKEFERLMLDTSKNKTHKINQRLAMLVALAANHFGYKTVIIYSGFRAFTTHQFTKKSKHNVGRAIDFAIEGVSNWKLMTYLRTLENTGVGYYPNSYFVHLDVREAPAFWVDYSGPGQKPHYGKMKPGLKKKAKKGSTAPLKADVDDEADSDASDVDIPKKP